MGKMGRERIWYDIDNNIVYEIKEGKGLIKEYDEIGNLEFEGEYLNGERNGKGKEINNFGCIIFEGEYLNGIRNGKGKEYNDENIVIFDGEYLNGKRHGIGKEYNDEGELIFEGEYLYDFRLKGKLYLNKHLEYEGEFLFDEKWNGKGFDENRNIIYEVINGEERYITNNYDIAKNER